MSDVNATDMPPCRTRRALVVVLLVLAVLPAVAVESLPPPSGRPLLLVRGAIEVHNSDAGAELDRGLLESLPAVEVRTETPWTDGVVAFEGPLLDALLRRLGAHGQTLRAIALNDYEVRIPIEDASRYRVVLAMRADGRTLGVRERGPLWLIYPWDEVPELRTESVYRRSIWQLRELFVEP